MKKLYLMIPFIYLGLQVNAQMVIQSGTTVFIESGAKITLQGDLTSSANIQGTGSVVMKGASLQYINMNGNTIPNLEIDNAADVTLTGGSTKIGTNLLFTTGKLRTSTQDLIMTPAATFTGYNASRFIWTDGTGQIKKEVTADISNYEIPVGENANYRPVAITTAGGSYSSAVLGVRNVAGSSINKPPSIASLISSHWPVTKSGFTGGTQTVRGQYIDADISGTEANLAGYYFNGTDWSSVNETHDAATNRAAAPVTSAAGEITAMNKFLAVGARAFLQGPYNSAASLMSDALRTGGNVIPLSEPYRTATYSGNFPHVNNPINELTTAGVLANQASANDDIVDWVFLQLRNTNTSPGNVVLQTRSALIQRDGDIVDVDGVSPVTFNNVAGGSYVLAIRHRNHLGMSTDNGSNVNWRTLAETKSIAFSTNVVDYRNSPSSKIYQGTANAYTTSTHNVLGTVNLLWGGDANVNNNVRYSASLNDVSVVLNQVLTFPGNVSQLYNYGSANGYFSGDVNMNKNVRYIGSSSDPAFILTNVLAVNTLYNGTLLVQKIPN